MNPTASSGADSTATPAHTTATPDVSGRGYVIQATTRLVVTDVLVTDSRGNPVHGLGQSAFHIFENGKPQVVRSFDEYRVHAPGLKTAKIEMPMDTYSSKAYDRSSPVLNVVLLDSLNTTMQDQMYLRLKLLKAMDEVDPGSRTAVLSLQGSRILLEQDFTAYPGLLRAAVNRSLPVMVNPDGEMNRLAYTFKAMAQVADYLSRIPGRKNLIWYADQFILSLDTGNSGAAGITMLPRMLTPQATLALEHIYNDLAVGRVAVYPVDARGVSYTDPFGNLLEMNRLAPPPEERLFWSETIWGKCSGKRSIQDRTSTPSPILRMAIRQTASGGGSK